MRNPGGYAIWVGGSLNNKSVERDTFSCFHCNTVVFVDPKSSPEEMGGFCRLCFKLICKLCVGLSCTPFEKKIEEMEKKAQQGNQLISYLNNNNKDK